MLKMILLKHWRKILRFLCFFAIHFLHEVSSIFSLYPHFVKGKTVKLLLIYIKCVYQEEIGRWFQFVTITKEVSDRNSSYHFFLMDGRKWKTRQIWTEDRRLSPLEKTQKYNISSSFVGMMVDGMPWKGSVARRERKSTIAPVDRRTIHLFILWECNSLQTPPWHHQSASFPLQWRQR